MPSDASVLRQKDLVLINISNVCVLVLGLVNALLVPKMAIKSMGTQKYGEYAFLLGLCMLPTILDLGLSTSLTREIGRLISERRQHEAKALILYFQRWVAGGGLMIVIVMAVIGAVISPHRPTAILGMSAGASANVLMIVTDLGLITRRVEGQIIRANVLRAVYHGTYLFSIGWLFLAQKITVPAMFFGQAIGAMAYAALGWWQARSTSSKQEERPINLKVPWRQLFSTALPEQVNRISNSIVPGVERSVILSMGGLSQLSAYDVAIRLSAIVTTLPAAVAEPLLAMLAPRMNAEKRQERETILSYAKWVTNGVTFATLIGGLFVAFVWAEQYYQLSGTSFKPFACMVMLGAGFNVLTASVVAALYAEGKPRPVLVKSLGDLGMVGIALAVVYLTREPMTYVGFRYLGYFVTAGWLLFYWRKEKGCMATMQANL